MELIFDEVTVGQALLTFLQSIDSGIYFDRAPRTTTFPYAVFKINNAFQREGVKHTFIMEIDLWHNKGNNITELLALQKSILQGVHKKGYADTNTTFYFNVESVLLLQDSEEQIRRRQIRVIVDYYNTQE